MLGFPFPAVLVFVLRVTDDFDSARDEDTGRASRLVSLPLETAVRIFVRGRGLGRLAYRGSFVLIVTDALVRREPGESRGLEVVDISGAFR